jgi:HK97 family phage portal protein
MAERNFLQRLFNIGIEEKQMPNNMVGYFGVGSGMDRNYKYQDLAKEGYMKNAIVFRCVNEIAKGASAVGYSLKQGEAVLERHPLLDLMARPNPQQSYSEFFNSLFGFLLLSGNAYVLKVGGAEPKELHLLRPDRIQIKGGNKPIPERYEYIINGRVQNVYDVDQDTGFSELKHIKLWNPLDDYYGCSPLAAAAVEVDQHNLASKHNINLLNNGARPSGAVIFKPKDDSGFAVNLTEAQRQQLLTDLNNRFSGSQNAGRPMLLEGDFDWKEMGLSPKDMDFLNLKHMSATSIALCFGVPSQLVGVPDSQTYSNVAEARLALYEETIIPHLKLIESDLNEWLVPMFREGLELNFLTEDIPALAERKKKTYENITSAVREGIMSRNEAREIIGLSPITGGDDVYISGTLFPLGSEEPVAPVKPDNEDDEKEYDFDIDEEELVEFDEEKAIADVDLTPTDGMKAEAERGLKWRKEHNRGGTMVGVARANQLVRKETLSPSTVRRMFSFFSRHEVDKQAEGFKAGEEGYPSAGRIAWALWGGDAGFSWSTKKRNQLEAAQEKYLDTDTHVGEVEFEHKKLTGKTRTALQNKVKEHNEKYGDNKTKRVTLGMLEKVFRRGVGAFNTNPASVRPSVNNSDQWALARVNSFLRALRTGRFKSGKHDTDVFPTGHPLKSKGPVDPKTGKPKKK